MLNFVLPNEFTGVYLCFSRHRDLNAPERADNRRLADGRSRIEHVNAYVVYSHEMFHGRPFIGTFEDLNVYITITVHSTSLLMKAEPTRGEHFGRFNHPHYSSR